MADATAQVGRPLVAGLFMQIRAVADRQLAQGAWDRLKRRPAAERRSLVRKSREYRGWAVCELACEESLKAAPDSAAPPFSTSGVPSESKFPQTASP
jgi:hypothetical protein